MKLLLIKLFTKLVYAIGILVGGLSSVGRPNRGNWTKMPTKMIIEAGRSGWEHISLQELHQSAVEFLGSESVVPLKIDEEKSYFAQAKQCVEGERPTHYFYDPRTGNQSFWPALFEAFRLLVLFSRRKIVPIAYCTDISLRRWRLQSAIITARWGLCVSLTEKGIALKMFPHQRIIGPSLMPISIRTFEELLTKSRNRQRSATLKVAFYGSLYEPRLTQLTQIASSLEKLGIKFEIKGRVPGGPRISRNEYWDELISTDILVSTSSQMLAKGLDMQDTNHLIWRFTEALVCGTCLVIESAPGVGKYFSDGENLLLWEEASEVPRLVESLFLDKDRLETIRGSGQRLMGALIREHTFWSEINLQLSASQKLL